MSAGPALSPDSPAMEHTAAMRNSLRLFALVLAAFAAPWAAAAERPNFLVILCDDLGYGDLGCYGHSAIKTPNLDRLAEQGWRFTDCYSAAPVCSSSRAGLLTGRTPSRVGVYNWIPGGNVMHLPSSEITIAHLLQKAGYDTATVGKWHCNGKFNSPDQPQPGDAGFDHWFATQNNAAPSHRNPRNFVRNGKAVGPTEGFSSQVVAAEGIEWLKSRGDQTKPFFLNVCFHEPHEPIDSPEELVARYEAAGVTEKGKALYYANVENLDAAVGKLLQTLDDMKLADNTMVFFTSDNGPETLDRYQNAWRSHGTTGPLRGMKLWMYDGGIRVAGIMRYPGHTKPGEEPRVPIASLDLLPTFCELAGIEPPADRPLDGTSLVPLFRGQPLQRQQPLFWHYYNALGEPKLALRDGDFMLLAHVNQQRGGPGGGGFQPAMMPQIKDAEPTSYELYNVAKDTGQEHDLAQQQPERLKAMAAALNEIWSAVKAEGPDWRN